MFARLTVHFPFQPTRSFLIEGDAASVIGRDSECDLVLEDDRVSRRHARLSFASGAWWLADLGSKNGTSLQGVPVHEASPCRDGWISFGGLLARFAQTTPERERAEARRHEERFKTSISRQSELIPSLGLERLLERVLASIVELSSAERGAVLLRHDDGVIEVAARSDLPDAELTDAGFVGSVGAIERSLSTAKSVAVSDVLSDPFLKGRESVLTGGIRALVCVPLVAADRMIGLIYADSRTPGTSYGELDVAILETLAAHAALAIATARTDRELKGLAARLPQLGTSWSGVLSHHRPRDGGAS